MPPTNEERIGVLESSVTDLRHDVSEVKQDIRSIRNDLMLRPRREDARATTIAWTVSGMCFSGLVSAVLIIAGTL